MKLMLVSDSGQLKPFFNRTFATQSCSVIHYRDPTKAIDNITEITPDAVVFSTTDFPRHWKPFVTFIRERFSRHECVFVLLAAPRFVEEAAGEAEALQVNAILDEDLSNEATIQRIRTVLGRYRQTSDPRRAQRYAPQAEDRVRFVFVNPYSLALVGGRVVDVSSGGLRLDPDDTNLADQLDTYATISLATLRLGDTLFDMAARVVRIGTTVALEFQDLSMETEKSIAGYVDMRLHDEWVQRGVEER